MGPDIVKCPLGGKIAPDSELLDKRFHQGGSTDCVRGRGGLAGERVACLTLKDRPECPERRLGSLGYSRWREI